LNEGKYKKKVKRKLRWNGNWSPPGIFFGGNPTNSWERTEKNRVVNGPKGFSRNFGIKNGMLKTFFPLVKV